MTTTKRRSDRWARRIGLVLGLSLIVAAGMQARIPGGTGTLGADVTVLTNPTGELNVTPAGPFVRGLAMHPGSQADAATGSVEVHNQTGTTLAVHVRGTPSITDLDDLLWMRVVAGDEELFAGTMRELRDWTTRSFTLASGQSTRLVVSTWLPPTITDGYGGRIEDIGLEYLVEPVGG